MSLGIDSLSRSFDPSQLDGLAERLAQLQQQQPQPIDRSMQVFSADTFSSVGGNTPATDTVRRLGPTTNPKYQPRNGNTYCNVFTQDYLRARGLTPQQFPSGKLANDYNKWLKSPEAARQGWRQVSAEEAQRWVNNGGVGIASRYNAHGHGHIAPIIEGQTQGGFPTISNVGSRNFFSGPASQSPAFRAGPTTYWIKT